MSKRKIHVFSQWLQGETYAAVCGATFIRDPANPVPTKNDLRDADCLHCLNWIAESQSRKALDCSASAVAAMERAKRVRLREARRKMR